MLTLVENKVIVHLFSSQRLFSKKGFEKYYAQTLPQITVFFTREIEPAEVDTDYWEVYVSGARHCRSDFNLVAHTLSVSQDELDNS